MRPQSGMLLLEMLVAMAIAAILLTGTLAMVQALVGANAATTQAFELDTGVHRVLRSITREIRDADRVTMDGKQVTVRRADGRVSMFEATSNGSELHEFNAFTSLGARTIAFFTRIDDKPVARMTDRGYLVDEDYRMTALIQGIEGVQWIPVEDPVDASVIGMKVSISYRTEAGLVTSSRVAVCSGLVAVDGSGS